MMNRVRTPPTDPLVTRNRLGARHFFFTDRIRRAITMDGHERAVIGGQADMKIERLRAASRAALFVWLAAAGCWNSGAKTTARGDGGSAGGGGSAGNGGAGGGGHGGDGGGSAGGGGGSAGGAAGIDAATQDAALAGASGRGDGGGGSSATGAGGSGGKDAGAGGSGPAGGSAGGAGGTTAKDGGAGTSGAGGSSVSGAGGAGGSSMAGASGGGGGIAGGGGNSATGPSLTVALNETPEAFRNPMKGFRPSRYIPDGAFPDGEYVSTYKHYIPYSALESSAADGVQKIKDWSDANWSGLRAKNRKVIPRVLIVYPGTGEYWADIPHDGTPAQWTTDALKARLVAFVAKLGQAWDDDPRVAAVEMGLWGKWGEHNIYPDQVGGSDRIPAAFQQALGDAFNAAFKNKKILARYPNTFANDTNVGFYWDSFALPDDDNAGGGAGIVSRDVWRTQMLSGEVAYDWGDQSHLGGSPAGTLSSASNTDYVIGYVQRLHQSSLGWIAQYTPDGGTISANAARLQKAMGYRFVVTQAQFTAAMATGGSIDLSLSVANVGSAPFYYRWPVAVSLLDDARKVVWRSTFGNVDITSWAPGSAASTVRGSFSPTVPPGTYTLAVAVLDPAGSGPSLRFANTNYYRGGWTPVGRVAVGGAAQPPTQDLGAFDGLKADDTLAY
jgi:hypothetical protein